MMGESSFFPKSLVAIVKESIAEERWVTIYVDCCKEDLAFDPFDIPEGTFEWSAYVWLKAWTGEVDADCVGAALRFPFS